MQTFREFEPEIPDDAKELPSGGSFFALFFAFFIDCSDIILGGYVMNKQTSPFAALTGAEKQIRWLEYQSIRLPYVDAAPNDTKNADALSQTSIQPKEKTPQTQPERPAPPPEVPRTINEFQKTRHSQYDAVIARMKQAELQARGNLSQIPKQR